MSNSPTVPPEPWTFVQEASDRLLEQIVADDGFSPETIAAARRLLDRLAASGRLTREPEHRHILRSKLAYWASEIRFETSELVHPPRLSPAGQGPGLEIEEEAPFLEHLEKGIGVDAREVQGAQFEGAGRFLQRVSVLNSFLLRCSMEHFGVAANFAVARTSVVGGDYTQIQAATFNATDARFLGVTIKNLEVASAPIFKSVRMPHTIVHGGALVGAVFDFANLAGGNDIDAKDVPDIEHYGVARDGTGATHFWGVDLRNATFGADAYLKGTTFDNCNLAGARFAGSSLAGTVFIDCDFGGNEFIGARDSDLATVDDSRANPAPDPRAASLTPDDQSAL